MLYGRRQRQPQSRPLHLLRHCCCLQQAGRQSQSQRPSQELQAIRLPRPSRRCLLRHRPLRTLRKPPPAGAAGEGPSSEPPRQLDPVRGLELGRKMDRHGLLPHAAAQHWHSPGRQKRTRTSLCSDRQLEGAQLPVRNQPRMKGRLQASRRRQAARMQQVHRQQRQFGAASAGASSSPRTGQTRLHPTLASTRCRYPDQHAPLLPRLAGPGRAQSRHRPAMRQLGRRRRGCSGHRRRRRCLQARRQMQALESLERPAARGD